MRQWKNNLTLILRVLFIILMLATGIGKLLDIPGFAKVIEAYQIGLSSYFAIAIGFSLAMFEFQLGVHLIRKPESVLSGFLLTFMHLGYTALAIITLARGIPIENCGCFGVFLARPMTIQTIFEDLFLVLLSALFWYLLKLQANSYSSQK
jgi:hypothetical protein